MSNAVVYIALSVGAAFGFAAAAALQQYEAAKAPSDQALKPGLLGSLLRRPIWLAGIGAQIVGYVLQLIALALGPIVVVEPIRSLQIVFALLLGMRFTHQSATRRDWAGAAMVTGGIAVFIIVSDPSAGNYRPGALDWIIATLVVCVAAGATVFAGLRASGGTRSALWGMAAGLLFGLQIALLKRVTDTFVHGDGFFDDLVTALTEPFIYGAIVAVLLGFLLVQSAFQAGSLENTIASYTALDVVTSVLLGVWLFGERLHHTDWRLVVIGASFVVIIVGIVTLARSKLLAITPQRIGADKGGS